jgi:long-chain acyl-CoA synthetase
MDAFVEILRQARCTALTGVNTLYGALVMHPKISEVDFSRLRVAIGGGAAVLPTTSAKWKALTGKDILEGYGLSETSPILTLNPPTATNGFSATVGLPFPSTDIKLLDADDEEAAIGEPGEVCAKGPQVMQGYWQKPQANADAFTADGYFRTGDIGVFDAKGFLQIVDRKKDMIIVSGFNVFPNEVEAIAAACPGVAECACVGRPDEKTGEAVRLFVAKAPGACARICAGCHRGRPWRWRNTPWRARRNSSAASSARPAGSWSTRTASTPSPPAPAIGNGSTSTSRAPSARVRSEGRSPTAISPCHWSPRW